MYVYVVHAYVSVSNIRKTQARPLTTIFPISKGGKHTRARLLSFERFLSDNNTQKAFEDVKNHFRLVHCLFVCLWLHWDIEGIESIPLQNLAIGAVQQCCLVLRRVGRT